MTDEIEPPMETVDGVQDRSAEPSLKNPRRWLIAAGSLAVVVVVAIAAVLLLSRSGPRDLAGRIEVFPPDSGGLCSSGVGVSIRADDEWVNEFASVESPAPVDVVARIKAEDERDDAVDDEVGSPLEPLCELYFSADVPDVKRYWISVDGVGSSNGEGLLYSASDLDDTSDVVRQEVTEGRPITVSEAGMTESSAVDLMRLARDQCRSVAPDGSGRIMDLTEDMLTIAATDSSQGGEFDVFDCVLAVLEADEQVLFEYRQLTRQFDGAHNFQLSYPLDAYWEWNESFRAAITPAGLTLQDLDFDTTATSDLIERFATYWKDGRVDDALLLSTDTVIDTIANMAAPADGFAIECFHDEGGFPMCGTQLSDGSLVVFTVESGVVTEVRPWDPDLG